MTTTSTRAQRVARRRRRWGVIGVAALVFVTSLYLALPALVAWRMRAMLAERGLTDVRFDVGSVGIRHLRLLDVHVGDEVLGTIELDAGLSMLWGDRVRNVTVQGASVTPAITHRFARGPVRAVPFETVTFSDCVLTVAGRMIGFDGTVTASDVPSRRFDLEWSAHEATASQRWTANARGRLVADAGELELSDGHATLAIERVAVGSTTIQDATVTLDGSGRIRDLELAVRGDIRISSLTVGKATARDVQIPFAVSARNGEITSGDQLVARARTLEVMRPGGPLSTIDVVASVGDEHHPLVLRTWPSEVAMKVREVRWSDARLAGASGTIATATGAVRWRAHDGRWGSAKFVGPSGEFARGGHVLRWRSAVAARGPRLGAGELRVRNATEGFRIEGGDVAIAGGRIAVAPFVAHSGRALTLALRATGLDLRWLLAHVPGQRLEGTGIIDGELAVRIDTAGWSITRGDLRARGPGTLRVRAPASVAAKVGDLSYSRLSAVIFPPGSDPEMRVTAAGKSSRSPQEIDLVLNLHGLRKVAQKLFARTSGVTR